MLATARSDTRPAALENGGGGIKPPSEGSHRDIPERPGVAKHAESRRWRVRLAPGVTLSFQEIRNVSGTCGAAALDVHSIPRPGYQRPPNRRACTWQGDAPPPLACASQLNRGLVAGGDATTGLRWLPVHGHHMDTTQSSMACPACSRTVRHRVQL